MFKTSKSKIGQDIERAKDSWELFLKLDSMGMVRPRVFNTIMDNMGVEAYQKFGKGCARQKKRKD